MATFQLCQGGLKKESNLTISVSKRKLTQSSKKPCALRFPFNLFQMRFNIEIFPSWEFSLLRCFSDLNVTNTFWTALPWFALPDVIFFEKKNPISSFYTFDLYEKKSDHLGKQNAFKYEGEKKVLFSQERAIVSGAMNCVT